jgi:hypothetical protein
MRMTSAPVLLVSACWWVDVHGQDGEAPVSHHPTREAAIAHHLDQVRRHHGAHLSDIEAVLAVPGTVRQAPRLCWEWTCLA